jgi:uncharacterized RDD family membrane protein YckC/predicted DNA-binding WGR domain protein
VHHIVANSLPQTMCINQEQMNTERTYVEYRDNGGNHLFHEVVSTGMQVDVRTGRVGTQGILRSTTFGTTDEARRAANAEIEILQARHNQGAEQQQPSTLDGMGSASNSASNSVQFDARLSAAHLTTAPSTTELYADFGKRTTAWMIDIVVQSAIYFGGSALLWGTPGNTFALLGLWSAGVMFGYSAWFESSEWQATPGKRAMGIIVTDADGERLSFGRALMRSAAKLGVWLFTGGMGFATAALTPRKQALHDVVVGTLVYSDDEHSRRLRLLREQNGIEQRGNDEQQHIQNSVQKSLQNAAEKAVLQTAQRHRGVITQAIVALETPLSLDEAEQALQALATQRVCSMDIAENGVIQYRFPAFTQDAGK